jgi:hypothetical protein
MDETSGIWLEHCKKVVYMGHRRFLQVDHPYQKNKKAFDGPIEKWCAPEIQNGEHMFRMVKILKLFLERGNEEELKIQRRRERMQRRMRRIMETKLQDC